jgi:hypothetical protein
MRKLTVVSYHAEKRGFSPIYDTGEKPIKASWQECSSSVVIKVMSLETESYQSAITGDRLRCAYQLLPAVFDGATEVSYIDCAGLEVWIGNLQSDETSNPGDTVIAAHEELYISYNINKTQID